MIKHEVTFKTSEGPETISFFSEDGEHESTIALRRQAFIECIHQSRAWFDGRGTGFHENIVNTDIMPIFGGVFEAHSKLAHAAELAEERGL